MNNYFHYHLDRLKRLYILFQILKLKFDIEILDLIIDTHVKFSNTYLKFCYWLNSVINVFTEESKN